MTEALDAGVPKGLTTNPSTAAIVAGNVVAVLCQHFPDAEDPDRAATLQRIGREPVLTGRGFTTG